MEKYPIYWPQFYTATILEWRPLLKPGKYKDIIIQCLQYLTTNKKITLYAFVIMDNHIHLIWQALPGKTPEQIQLSFMKYTANKIRSGRKSSAGTGYIQVKCKRQNIPVLGKKIIGYRVVFT